MSAIFTDLIELSEAAKLLPKRHGKKIHVKTIKRWIVKGCRGIRLGGQKIGDVWFTSAAWLRQFHDECTRRASRESECDRPPAVVSEAARRAERELARRFGFDATETDAAAQVPHVRQQGHAARTV
jgi:hypothetical protein